MENFDFENKFALKNERDLIRDIFEAKTTLEYFVENGFQNQISS